MVNVKSVEKKLEAVEEALVKGGSSFAWQLLKEKSKTNRLLIKCIVIICVLWAVSCLGFVYFISQYDFQTYEYTQDGNGINIIGDNNSEVNNGTESKN